MLQPTEVLYIKMRLLFIQFHMFKYVIGYTVQYLDLNPLADLYNNLGFFITGFPCNQFGLQEPAKNHEILNGIKYVRPGAGYTPTTNFHIYGKLMVNGDDAHPMYKFLKVHQSLSSHNTSGNLIIPHLLVGCLPVNN